MELRLHWGLGWKLDWRFGWILNRRSVSRLDWARVKTGDWFGESGLGICLKTGQERDMESGMEIGDWIGCCVGWGLENENWGQENGDWRPSLSLSPSRSLYLSLYGPRSLFCYSLLPLPSVFSFFPPYASYSSSLVLPRPTNEYHYSGLILGLCHSSNQ